jgi:hypothetical protein
MRQCRTTSPGDLFRNIAGIPEFEHRLPVRNGIQVYDRPLFGGDDPVISGRSWPVSAISRRAVRHRRLSADQLVAAF